MKGVAYQKKSKGGRLQIGNLSVKKPTATNTSVPRKGSGKINVKLPDFS